MSLRFQDFFKVCAIAITLLAFAPQINAATYYVDYATGSDANNGTATSTPWQHCPGDSSATGNAASATLTAGDTVYFKGGVSYVLTAINSTPWLQKAGINLSWSGTLASPITYDGNSSGAWGSGKAVITDNHSTNNLIAFYNSGAVSNLVFLNFSFTGIGGSNALPADPGHTSYAPSGIPKKGGSGIGANVLNNVLISDCYFGQLGYYQNVYPIGNASLSGSAIGSHSCNGLVITNCEFTQMRNPIFISGSNAVNFTVANCYFHDQMEWAISSTMSSQFSVRSNVFIYGNTFSNTDQYYVDHTQGGQWNAYDVGGPHCNCIMFFGPEDVSGAFPIDRIYGDTNVFIYNNTFISTMGYPGGTTSVWLQDGASGNIYNNVFNNTMANNAVVISSTPTNGLLRVGIYNNTFYAGVPAVAICGIPNVSYGWFTTTTNRLITVANNLFSTLGIGNNNAYNYNLPISTRSTNAAQNIFFDYNAYACDQQYTSQSVAGFWSPGDGVFYAGYLTLSHSRQFGWDAHSVDMHNVSPNSLFTLATFTNAVANNFHLPTNSLAIAAGLNLTSLGLPGLNADKDGNPRLAIGPWTMGAFSAIGSSLAPYVSLVASTNSVVNGQSVALSWTSLNATSVTLSGVGSVAASGNTILAPAQTTTYVLTAVGTKGTSSANATVVVRPLPPPGIPTATPTPK